MKKSLVSRVLSIVLLAACLVGIPLLSACSSGETAEPEEVVPEEPTFAVQIFIDCDQNLIFSRYDVDVKVDGENIGNVDHGGESTFQVNLTKGQHELVFVEEGRTSPDGKTSIVVNGEGEKYSYRIHCTRDQVEIKSIAEEKKEASTEQASDTRVVSHDGASIEVPGAWKVQDAEGGKYIETEYGGIAFLYSNNIEEPIPPANETYALFVSGIQESGQYSFAGQAEEIKIGEAVAFKDKTTFLYEGASYPGKSLIVLSEHKVYLLFFVMPDSVYDEHSSDIDAIIGSIKLDNPSAPVFLDDSAEAKQEGDAPDEEKNTEETEPATDNEVAEEAEAVAEEMSTKVEDATEDAEAAQEAEAEETKEDAEATQEAEVEPSKYELAFVRRMNEYSLYYLIDLDEMTATSFGTNDSGSMVLPCTGDLENGLTIDYGSEGFTERLQYKSAGNDSKAILIDGSGFEWEYEKTGVAEAEAVLASVS